MGKGSEGTKFSRLFPPDMWVSKSWELKKLGCWQWCGGVDGCFTSAQVLWNALALFDHGKTLAGQKIKVKFREKKIPQVLVIEGGGITRPG